MAAALVQPDVKARRGKPLIVAALRRRHRAAVKSLLAASLVAPVALLAESARGQPATGSRTDTVVKVVTTARHAQLGRLIQEVSIGVADGPQEYLLGRVRDVLAARNGWIWILEAGLLRRNGVQLRVYDSTGRFIRVVGRLGQGPGELRGPANLAQLPDGHVLVWEPAPVSRFTIYSDGGEYVDTWVLDELRSAQSGGRGALHTDSAGNVYLRITTREDVERPARVPAGPSMVRIRDGSVLDTVPGPSDIPDAARPGITIAGQRRGRIVVAAPYSPSTLAAWSPLGYWVTGVSTRYAFELRVPPAETQGAATGARAERRASRIWSAGDPVISVRRNVPPVQVTAAERRERAAHLEAQLRSSNAGQQNILESVPSVKPAYYQLETAQDGKIWVQVATPSERYDPPQEPASSSPPLSWREPTTYDVFEPDGSYVGRVAVPYNTRLLRMDGDVVWGIATDADGVESVRRFHARWQ